MGESSKLEANVFGEEPDSGRRLLSHLSGSGDESAALGGGGGRMLSSSCHSLNSASWRVSSFLNVDFIMFRKVDVDGSASAFVVCAAGAGGRSRLGLCKSFDHREGDADGVVVSKSRSGKLASRLGVGMLNSAESSAAT